MAKPPKKTREDLDDAAYTNGSERAWMTMLMECLRHLGYDSPDAQKVAWVTERQAAIVSLRRLCAEFGDIDWPDDLHLEDIIEKHLGDYLRR
jgi:hypothetical protein